MRPQPFSPKSGVAVSLQTPDDGYHEQRLNVRAPAHLRFPISWARQPAPAKRLLSHTSALALYILALFAIPAVHAFLRFPFAVFRARLRWGWASSPAVPVTGTAVFSSVLPISVVRPWLSYIDVPPVVPAQIDVPRKRSCAAPCAIDVIVIIACVYMEIHINSRIVIISIVRAPGVVISRVASGQAETESDRCAAG